MPTTPRSIRVGWGVAGLVPGGVSQMFYNVFGRDAAGAYGELVPRSNAGVSEERTGCYRAEVATWDSRWRDWAVYWDQAGGDPYLSEQAPFGVDVHHVNARPAEPASGGGAFAVTVVVTNVAGGAAIVGASVRMTSASGSYEAATNGLGEATLNLDGDTYTLGVFKEGFLYAASSHVVSGAGEISAAMTQVSIAAPANPGQTTGYLVTFDGKGNVKPGVTITFRLKDPVGNEGGAFDRRNFTATSDGAGLLQVTLMRNSAYQAKHEKGEWIEIPTTGNAATFALPEILSDYGS